MAEVSDNNIVAILFYNSSELTVDINKTIDIFDDLSDRDAY